VNTPQQEGMAQEKKAAKSQGLRLHPRSGAGIIKHDMSDDDILLEHKWAGKTITVKAEDLLGLYNRAAMQSKDAVFQITFKNGVRLTGMVDRTVGIVSDE
tara:strand:+ start:75 stop:374 length:300 start_codon:yes stop_codon:yes gene_type:complete